MSVIRIKTKIKVVSDLNGAEAKPINCNKYKTDLPTAVCKNWGFGFNLMLFLYLVCLGLIQCLGLLNPTFASHGTLADSLEKLKTERNNNIEILA